MTNHFFSSHGQEVSEVDDSSLSISIRLAFYIYWNDSRIIRLKDGEQSIQLGSAAFEKYFLPDFYIYKLLDFKQMEFADPLKALLLTPAGKMWYVSIPVTKQLRNGYFLFSYLTWRQ